jgi:hypothetical protein
MESNKDVFISHSSIDSKLAYAMCHFLEEKGIRCWIAPRDVQGGREYAESIIMGIRSCEIMVVLCGKNANDSIYVDNEVERAFNYNSILIPFKVDQTLPSAALELFLGSVHSLDATSGNPEDHFDLLYQNCARVLGKKERVIEEKPVLAVPISEKTIIDNSEIDHVAPPSLNENNMVPPSSSSSKTNSTKKIVLASFVAFGLIFIITLGILFFINSNEATIAASGEAMYENKKDINIPQSEENFADTIIHIEAAKAAEPKKVAKPAKAAKAAKSPKRKVRASSRGTEPEPLKIPIPTLNLEDFKESIKG